MKKRDGVGYYWCQLLQSGCRTYSGEGKEGARGRVRSKNKICCIIKMRNWHSMRFKLFIAILSRPKLPAVIRSQPKNPRTLIKNGPPYDISQN